MTVKTTTAAAIVVAALTIGVGVTPARAAERPTAVASASTVSHSPSTSSTAATSSVARTRVSSVSSVEGVSGAHQGSTRIIPAIVAAAFVAAARVVPRLLPLLKPVVKKGASAFFAAVKKYAPRNIAEIIRGATTLIVFEVIKRLFGW
jgi:hypothetical protein